MPTSSQARWATLVGVKTAEEAAEGCRRRRLPRLGHVRMLRRTGRVAVAGATWTRAQAIMLSVQSPGQR